jgi:hypothetical protein
MSTTPTTLPPMPCPTTPTPYDDDPTEMMAGCGSTDLSEPDREGLIDCGYCGMWFNPTTEYGPDWQSRYRIASGGAQP